MNFHLTLARLKKKKTFSKHLKKIDESTLTV